MENVNAFDATADEDEFENFELPDFDREYLYAVITYLFPGLLTGLVRAAAT